MRIGLLENDPGIREMLEIALSLRGHTVAGYADPFEFLRAFLSENTYDVLLVDYRPGADLPGDLVVRVVRPNIPCVLMSTTPRSWFDTRLSALSDVPFLKKPLHPHDLFLLPLTAVAWRHSPPLVYERSRRRLRGASSYRRSSSGAL